MFPASCFSRSWAISVVILALASPAFARQAPVAGPSTKETGPQATPSPAPANAAPKPTHYKRNGALIGLGAGMGTVFIASCAQYEGSCGQAAAGAAVWGAIGAGIGAWIGSGMTPRVNDGTPAAISTATFADQVKGKRVLVTTIDGRQFDGHVQATSAGLQTDSGITLSSDQIKRVQLVTHRVEKGLLIGLAGGLAIGVGSYFGSCEDECANSALVLGPAIGAGIGAALGAAGNASHRRSDVLFEAKPKTSTTFSVAPILSKTRKGVAVSLSWR